MPDVPKVLADNDDNADNAVQAAVCHTLKQRPGFQVDYHLPNFLEEKLKRLDRVTAKFLEP